jgi:hypothetical protein
MAAKSDPTAVDRAHHLRQRIAAKGLTIADFGRQVGFSRNVTYGVLKGRKLRPGETRKIDEVLGSDS